MEGADGGSWKNTPVERRKLVDRSKVRIWRSKIRWKWAENETIDPWW